MSAPYSPPPVPEGELAGFRDFVDAHRWVFARSMPRNPHWYVVRQRCRDDGEFVGMILFLHRYGVPDPFGRHVNAAFVDRGFKYWTMQPWEPGPNLEDARIINRKPLPG